MSDPEQLPLAFPSPPSLRESDFIVADSNAVARQAVKRWPDWPEAAQGLRALAIVGPAGCGKSHLAAIWSARADAIWINESNASDVTRVSPCKRAAVIDGLDAWVSANATARESVLHLFNEISDRKGWLLVTSRVPPSRLAIEIPDLASRLATISTLQVTWPDDSLLECLLIKLFSDRQLRPQPDVIPYMVNRVERTYAMIEACVVELDRESLKESRNITLPLAREVLGRLQGR